MSDTWASILAISVAVMALVQVGYLIAFTIAARKAFNVVENTQARLDVLAGDLRLQIGSMTDRVNAVADDVKAVTARVQQVASTVSDGVQRVEKSVRTAGQRVATTIEQVPAPVKKGVPVGLALIAAIRTVQQVRSRMRSDRTRSIPSTGDPYRDAYSNRDFYASTGV
jgi:uncharacterized protein YoxC